MRLSVLLFVLTLFGCEELPAGPVCRTGPIDNTPASRAACVLRHNNTVVLITLPDMQGLQLANASVLPGETPQCAAHRAMWQQTGLNVLVGKAGSITAEGIQLYACRADEALAGMDISASPVNWAEASGLTAIDPFDLQQRSLTTPSLLIPLRDTFILAGQSSAVIQEGN